MKNPKVSIIIPAYNAEKFIERAIRNVSNQTFQDFEIIVVDDGSTDKTVEIVKKLQKEDKRIKLIELKENSGGAGAVIPRTIGCKEAKGEFIAFLDSDDLYYPEYLELKVKYSEEHLEIDEISSCNWAFDEKTKRIINYNVGTASNFFMRRKAIEEVISFNIIKNIQDDISCFLIDILKIRFGKTKKLSSEPVTLYSIHHSQSSFRVEKKPKEYVQGMKNLIEEITYKIKYLDDKLKKRFVDHLNLNVLYRRLGSYYCLAGDFEKGRKCFLKSLKIKINLLALGGLILSFFGFNLYRKIEFYLRILKIKYLGRFEVLIKRIKYKKSYNKAREILSQY